MLSIAERLRAALAPSGLDLVVTAPVAPYNAAVDARWRLPALGRAYVIGARALWDAFMAAIAADPRRAAAPNPLDEHVAAAVRGAVDALAIAPRHELRSPSSVRRAGWPSWEQPR